MALVKTIIKNSAQEVVVKWTGSGTDTLTLSSLVAAEQTLTGDVGPGAVITNVISSVGTTATCVITRNAVDVLYVHGNFVFNNENYPNIVINEKSTFDVAVNLTGAGTLILKLKKTQGYSSVF